jgi:hypothetical protein
MFYLAEIRKELERVDETEEDEVIAQHPRYAELCKEYGTPTVNRVTDDSSANLSKFKFVKKSKDDMYDPLFELSLFKYFSMYDLFFYAAQPLKAKPMDIHLYWITKAQQAKMYRLENFGDAQESDQVPEEPTGWATSEVELTRSVKLLDLVFYDDINLIRIKVNPVELDESTPVLPDRQLAFGEFQKVLDDFQSWRTTKTEDATGSAG